MFQETTWKVIIKEADSARGSNWIPNGVYCTQERTDETMSIVQLSSDLEMNYTIILENVKGCFVPIEKDSEAINQFRTISFRNEHIQ